MFVAFWLNKVRQKMHEWDAHTSQLPWRWEYTVIFFLIAFVCTVLRRPDLVLNAQFWAEDGRVWFANAYQLGPILPLFQPVTGYFQTVSRVIADLAQLMPLRLTPLFFNIVAISLKCLPAIFLFSPRFRKLVPSFFTALLLYVLYLFLPNSEELLANVTNAHTYLALLAFMYVVATPPSTRAQKTLEGMALFIAGLSGPFVLFLAPVVGAMMYRAKSIKSITHLWLLLPGALIQAVSILLQAGGTRSAMSLGASPFLFLKIISLQLIMGPILGSSNTGHLVDLVRFSHSWIAAGFMGAMVLIGFVLVGFAIWKGSFALKLFLLFAGLCFFAALAKPMASLDVSQWSIMAIPGNAARYWFFPMLAFLAVIVWGLGQRSLIKVGSMIVLLVASFGYVTSARIQAWPDLHFQNYAKTFEQLPAGQSIKIPIMPVGWSMELVKK